VLRAPLLVKSWQRAITLGHFNLNVMIFTLSRNDVAQVVAYGSRRDIYVRDVKTVMDLTCISNTVLTLMTLHLISVFIHQYDPHFSFTNWCTPLVLTLIGTLSHLKTRRIGSIMFAP
jgi:hypothetical protein